MGTRMNAYQRPARVTQALRLAPIAHERKTRKAGHRTTPRRTQRERWVSLRRPTPPAPTRHTQALRLARSRTRGQDMLYSSSTQWTEDLAVPPRRSPRWRCGQRRRDGCVAVSADEEDARQDIDAPAATVATGPSGSRREQHIGRRVGTSGATAPGDGSAKSNSTDETAHRSLVGYAPDRGSTEMAPMYERVEGELTSRANDEADGATSTAPGPSSRSQIESIAARCAKITTQCPANRNTKPNSYRTHVKRPSARWTPGPPCTQIAENRSHSARKRRNSQ